SGLWESGNPAVLRDFQARWESRFLDFSSARLFHSPSRRLFICSPGLTLCAVSAQPMRSVRQADRSIQMLMQGYRAVRQAGSPTHRFDLQAEVLKADRVVPVHRALELQREDEIQIPAAPGYKRAARLRRPHLKAAIELGDVVFSEKSIGPFQSADPMQPQFLRQPPLPGAKVTSLRPRACGE